MSDTIRTLLPVGDAVARAWPSDLIDLPADVVRELSATFEWIAIDPMQTSFSWDERGVTTRVWVVILERLRFPLPILDGAEIGLGTSESVVQFGAQISNVELRIEGVEFSLVVPPSLLGEVIYNEEAGSFTTVSQIDRETGREVGAKGYEFVWTAGLSTDLHTRFTFTVAETTPAKREETRPAADGSNAPGERIERPSGVKWARLADTPFLLQLSDFRLLSDGLSEAEAEELGAPPGFRGVFLGSIAVAYAEPGSNFKIEGRRIALGTGGLSGIVGFGLEEGWESGFALPPPPELTREELENDRPPPGAHAVNLQGFRAIVQRFAVEFTETIPTASDAAGYLFMPLAERWFRFRATIGGPDGAFILDFGGASGEPLISLDSDWLEIRADRITYLLEDGVHFVSVAGSVRPKIGDFDWPSLKVNDLRVSSNGEIDFKGGWIKLDEARTFDLGGFKVHLECLGFGEGGEGAERHSWIGFSGGITLVEGIPLSASVQGLEIRWRHNDPGDIDVSLKGVALGLEIPGTLRLRGAVSYGKEKFTFYNGGTHEEREVELFRGHVRLELISLKCEVDAELMIGEFHPYAGRSVTIFAATISLKLPVPILLGATGIGIYGFQGLFGMHVAPDRRLHDGNTEPEPWYEWYKRQAGNDPKTARSVTALSKWAPQPDHYAVGAGLFLGTAYDTGFSLNIRAFAAVLLPGPVIIIEGAANLLKVADGETEQEGALYVFVVFDGRAETLQINIDIRFAIAEVVEVGGGLEAFFDFADSRNWYINIGVKEPRAKRLHARVLAIIGADSYFMISSQAILFGADIGIDWRAEYGPLQIAIVARFGFAVGMHFEPFLFEGEIRLEGAVALRIFGIGLGLEFFVSLAGQTPTPWFIHGVARFALSLPWPLPSVSAEAEFLWGEDAPPLTVDPILDSLMLMHHRASDIYWKPLPFAAHTPAAGMTLAALEAALLASRAPRPEGEVTQEPSLPVVPVDVTPVAQFTKPIWSAGLPATGFETVDGYEIDYSLRDVVLRRIYRDSNGVEQREIERQMHIDIGTTMIHFDQYDLFPDHLAEAPALRLWRYDQFEHGDQRWRETRPAIPAPCADIQSRVQRCIDWLDVPDGTLYPRSFSRQTGTFSVEGEAGRNQPWRPRVNHKALVIEAGVLAVRLSAPATRVEIVLSADLVARGSIEAYFRGRRVATPRLPTEEIERFQGFPMVRFILDPEEALNQPPALIDTIRLRNTMDSRLFIDPFAVVGYLRQVCWSPVASRRGSRSARSSGGRPEKIPGTIETTAVLRTNSFYEFWLDVRGRRRPVGSTQWIDFPQTAKPTLFYFRTGDLPERHQLENANWNEHPINTIAPYLRATAPAAAAPSVYRGYDLAAEFAEPYAEGLFSNRLRLRVLDGASRPLGSTSSEAALPSPAAQLLRPSLVALALGRLHGGCSSPDGADLGAPRFWRAAPPMAPGRRHTLQVCVERADGSFAASHDAPFVTSRFADFHEHITSELNRLGPDHDPRGDGPHPLRRLGKGIRPPALDIEPLRAATDAWDAAVAAMRAAVGTTAALALARDLANAAFAELAAAAAAAYAAVDESCTPAFAEFPRVRGLPEERVEFIQVPVEEKGSLLLLQSPEAIAWRRIKLGLIEWSGSTVLRKEHPLVCWRPDSAMAFIVPRDGSAFSGTTLGVTLQYTGGGPHRPDLLLQTRNGIPPTDLATLRFQLRDQ